MPAWIENLTRNWTPLHYGLTAVLIGLWLMSCVRLALAVSRQGRSFPLWLVLTIVFLGIPAWIVVMVDLHRDVKRHQQARAAAGPPDLDATAGAPGQACPHCGFRLDSNDGSGPSVCPRCNMMLGQDRLA